MEKDHSGKTSLDSPEKENLLVFLLITFYEKSKIGRNHHLEDRLVKDEAGGSVNRSAKDKESLQDNAGMQPVPSVRFYGRRSCTCCWWRNLLLPLGQSSGHRGKANSTPGEGAVRSSPFLRGWT